MAWVHSSEFKVVINCQLSAIPKNISKQTYEIWNKTDVWLGKKDTVDVYAEDDIYITVPKRKKKPVKAVIEYNGPIKAPIEKGSKVGSLNVYVSDNLVKKFDIFSSEEIKGANIFSRLYKSFSFLVWGDV